MITKGDKIAFALIGLALFITIVFWEDVSSLFGSKEKAGQKKEMKKNKKKD